MKKNSALLKGNNSMRLALTSKVSLKYLLEYFGKNAGDSLYAPNIRSVKF